MDLEIISDKKKIIIKKKKKKISAACNKVGLCLKLDLDKSTIYTSLTTCVQEE